MKACGGRETQLKLKQVIVDLSGGGCMISKLLYTVVIYVVKLCCKPR